MWVAWAAWFRRCPRCDDVDFDDYVFLFVAFVGCRSSNAQVLPGYEHATEEDDLMELPRPADLPAEWSQMITKRGRIFYVKWVYLGISTLFSQP